MLELAGSAGRVMLVLVPAGVTAQSLPSLLWVRRVPPVVTKSRLPEKLLYRDTVVPASARGLMHRAARHRAAMHRERNAPLIRVLGAFVDISTLGHLCFRSVAVYVCLA